MTGHRPFSTLREKMSPESRARAEKKAAALREHMPLDELRTALELSQRQIAEALNIDQPAVSRLERRTDMMLSTLGRFVEAMGGKLELRAILPTGVVTIDGLGQLKRPEAEQMHHRKFRSGRARVLSAF